MAQTIYYIISALGVIFTGVMAILTYKLNKNTKQSEKNTKEISIEIKEIYENETSIRKNSEDISRLIERFSNITSHLEQLKTPESHLRSVGSSTENLVEMIYKEIVKINEFSFIFVENESSFNFEDYDLLDNIMNEQSDSLRKSNVKSLLKINSRYINILRRLHKDL